MGVERLAARWAGHAPTLLGGKYRFAVLCPFTETEQGLHLLLEVRSSQLRHWTGEVCFPGGQVEPGEDETACALRETREELNISPGRIRVLGRGDFVCDVAGFTLQPVLGVISPEGLASMHSSPDEVAEVLTVPVSFFQKTRPEIYTYTLDPSRPEGFPYEKVGIRRDYGWRHGQVEVPVWYWQGHAIWGMTARIIRSILPEAEES